MVRHNNTVDILESYDRGQGPLKELGIFDWMETPEVMKGREPNPASPYAFNGGTLSAQEFTDGLTGQRTVILKEACAEGSYEDYTTWDVPLATFRVNTADLIPTVVALEAWVAEAETRITVASEKIRSLSGMRPAGSPKLTTKERRERSQAEDDKRWYERRKYDLQAVRDYLVKEVAKGQGE